MNFTFKFFILDSMLKIVILLIILGFFLVEIKSCYVAQAGPQLKILLSLVCGILRLQPYAIIPSFFPPLQHLYQDSNPEPSVYYLSIMSSFCLKKKKKKKYGYQILRNFTLLLTQIVDMTVYQASASCVTACSFQPHITLIL